MIYHIDLFTALIERLSFFWGDGVGGTHQSECSPSESWITGLKDLQRRVQGKGNFSWDGPNVPFSLEELQHCKWSTSICCKLSKVYIDSDNLCSFPEKPVKQSSSVLISRQHLTLLVFPPCRLGLHFLDSPTDCWDVQRSLKYLSTQLCLVPMHRSGLNKQQTCSQSGQYAGWSMAPSKTGWGQPWSLPACQALKENTTRLFNSNH